jgi:PAS domain S-box-containing protein
VADKNLLRLMVEAVEDYAIYMLDPDGTVITWNSGAERVKGYASSEILGRNYSCLFTAESVAAGEPKRQLVETLAHGRFRVEGWRVRKDGALFWADIVLTTVYDDGILIGFVKVTRDLTERRKQQQALLAAKEAAEEASLSKSAFLANMSHELRTPLNAIIGFSEILEREMFGPLGNDRYRDYVACIAAGGNHLLTLVNDILDLSKLDSGTLLLEMEEVDLPALCAQAVRMVEPQALSAEITLVLAETAPARIKGSPRRLLQILLNLLSNALKFTKSGGTVSLSVRETRDHTELIVSDTGIGMAAADIPRALSIFGQIDSEHARKYPGSGLGLPLAKRLAELHGGVLELESVLGRGTTVTVRLLRGEISPVGRPSAPARGVTGGGGGLAPTS